jgi:2-dehydropantoate 2-reductase
MLIHSDHNDKMDGRKATEGGMKIKTAAIVGLGALGILYGHQLSKALPAGALKIVADRKRIDRYKSGGVYCNGELCAFDYVTPEQAEPADLVLVAVKQPGLIGAMDAMAGAVGENTVILSLLNGIASEPILAERFGADKLLACVAQGMDAVREGQSVRYTQMGWLVIGDMQPGPPSQKAQSVAAFFDAADVPHILADDMPRRLWNKFMLNVGVNQVLAGYGGGYGALQKPGPLRDMTMAAMREVMAIAKMEGIRLEEQDIADWMRLIATLSPDGKPSMQQDVEARRQSEVELFAGTVIALGQKHGVPTPVNEALYKRILEIERDY